MYIKHLGGVSVQVSALERRTLELCEGVSGDAAALGQISMQAVDGLFKLRHGGLEVGGILYGHRQSDHTEIAVSRVFEPSYAHGPIFRLLPRDVERFREMIAAPDSDPELAGLETVGWYVSHTRSELTLTEHDEQLFSDCFPLPGQVTLVLKPTKLDPSRAVIYKRDPQCGIAPSAEFTIDHRDVPPEEHPAPVPALTQMPVGVDEEAAEPELPGAPVPVEPAAAPVRGRQRIRGVAVLVCLFALIAGSLITIGWLRKSSSRPVASDANVITLQPVHSETVVQPQAVQPDVAPPRATPDESGDARVQALVRELAELRKQVRPPVQPAADTADRVTPQATPRRFVPPAFKAGPRGIAAAGPVTVPVPPPEIANGAQVAHPITPALPLPSTVAPEPPRAKPRSSGRLIWTGTLRKGALLFIDGGRPSSGSLTGAFPGGPVHLTIQTGELSPGGMLIYTPNPRASGRSEAPGQLNGWNHTIYEHDPKRLRDVQVMETPGSENAWRKLVLRSVNRQVGVIVVDWESAGSDIARP